MLFPLISIEVMAEKCGYSERNVDVAANPWSFHVIVIDEICRYIRR